METSNYEHNWKQLRKHLHSRIRHFQNRCDELDAYGNELTFLLASLSQLLIIENTMNEIENNVTYIYENGMQSLKLLS